MEPVASTYEEGDGWSYEVTFQHATTFRNIKIHHTSNKHLLASLKTLPNAHVINFDLMAI